MEHIVIVIMELLWYFIAKLQSILHKTTKCITQNYEAYCA